MESILINRSQLNTMWNEISEHLSFLMWGNNRAGLFPLLNRRFLSFQNFHLQFNQHQHKIPVVIFYFTSEKIPPTKKFKSTKIPKYSPGFKYICIRLYSRYDISKRQSGCTTAISILETGESEHAERPRSVLLLILHFYDCKVRFWYFIIISARKQCKIVTFLLRSRAIELKYET